MYYYCTKRLLISFCMYVFQELRTHMSDKQVAGCQPIIMLQLSGLLKKKERQTTQNHGTSHLF